MKVPASQLVRVSQHAAVRYQERVRPALDYPAARTELLRLVDAGEVVSGAPGWLYIHDAAETRPHFHIELSDGIAALGNSQGTLVTVIVRSSSNKARRENKNRRRAEKRAARRTRNRLKDPGNRRARIEGEAWPT